VDTLPQWERDLLDQVVFDVSPFHLTTMFTHMANFDTSAALEIQFVSDGSQIRDRMSFGWCLALPDGTRLAHCSGPGFGPGTSHRAEGYGVLSAVRFIYQLILYTQSSEPWPVCFTTDNKGLVIRLDQRKQYDISYANATLAPDWDIVEEIIMTLRLLPITPFFAHVKGHQDDTKAYEDLPLAAQLNVDADTLAGDHQTQFPSEHLVVPLLPSTGAHLCIGDRTITGHYSGRIREAASLPAYIAHLCKANHWVTAEWTNIDLVVYKRLIARNTHRHVNVVKYVHDKLPTATIRQYTDATITTTCIQCHASFESFSHVLRCPHPSRRDWRKELLRTIRRHCEDNTTRLVLLQILTKGLESWFTGDLLSTDGFPPDFHRLIHEQNAIGWYALLRGFTSRQWTIHQHTHLFHNDKVTKTVTGALWMVSLLQVIWDQIFVLWDLYKSDLHGIDVKAQATIKKRHLRQKIQALHDRRAEVRQSDQRWFIQDVDSYLARATPTAMTNWLATYEAIILDGIRLGHVDAIANTRSLRAYFPTTIPPRHTRTLAATINPRLHTVMDARSIAKRRKPRPRPVPAPTNTIRQFFQPIRLPPIRDPLEPPILHTTTTHQ
jgi:hypothetical protein